MSHVVCTIGRAENFSNLAVVASTERCTLGNRFSLLERARSVSCTTGARLKSWSRKAAADRDLRYLFFRCLEGSDAAVRAHGKEGSCTSRSLEFVLSGSAALAGEVI